MPITRDAAERLGDYGRRAYLEAHATLTTSECTQEDRDRADEVLVLLTGLPPDLRDGRFLRVHECCAAIRKEYRDCHKSLVDPRVHDSERSYAVRRLQAIARIDRRYAAEDKADEDKPLRRPTGGLARRVAGLETFITTVDASATRQLEALEDEVKTLAVRVAAAEGNAELRAKTTEGRVDALRHLVGDHRHDGFRNRSENRALEVRFEALEDQVKTLTNMARVESLAIDKLEDRLDKLSAGCRQMAADILALCAP